MQLIKGTPAEIDAFVELYQAVVRRMNELGIDQWDETYPSREILSDDLAKGELYWFTDGTQPLGAVVLNEEEGEEYPDGCWEDATARGIVIHRMGINTNVQGQGLAKKMMAVIEDFAREQGYGYVRLDTYTGNPIAVRLYEKCGYQTRGQFKSFWREPQFVLFEKKL